MAVEALHELRTESPQQGSGERKVRHLALDHEGEARRQCGGEHDAVEVAGVVADHHALARRNALGELHRERHTRHGEKGARQGAGGRAALLHARQHQQQHEGAESGDQECRDRPGGIEKPQRGKEERLEHGEQIHKVSCVM